MVDLHRPRRLQSTLVVGVVLTLVLAGCFSTARDRPDAGTDDETGTDGVPTGTDAGGTPAGNETAPGNGDPPDEDAAGPNGTGGGDNNTTAGPEPPEPVHIEDAGGADIQFETAFEWEVDANWSRIMVTYAFVPLTDAGPLVYSRVAAAVTANGERVCQVSTDSEIRNTPLILLQLEITPEGATCSHGGDPLEVAADVIAPGDWAFRSSGLAHTGWTFNATVAY